jgi:hypothetical protein
MHNCRCQARGACKELPWGISVLSIKVDLLRMSLLVLQVLELPEGAELLADSATAANEVWAFRTRALAIQGHPEMPASEALTKILTPLSANGCGVGPKTWTLQEIQCSHEHGCMQRVRS